MVMALPTFHALQVPISTAVSSSGSIGNFRDRNFGDGAESVQDSSADNFHGSALHHPMFGGGGVGGVNTASSSSINQQQQNAIQNTTASLVSTGNG